MKLIVTTPFRDKMFDNKIVREEGTIIDTDDSSFKCDEKLARERIKGGFCVEMEELPIENTEIKEKPANKGKKVSKKK